MIDERSNINLPPRVRLRIQDSATGSYPVSVRTGDPRGHIKNYFDDAQVIIFNTGVNVAMPTTLQPESSLAAGINSSLSTSGTVRKGIADNTQTSFLTDIFEPFIEDRLIPRVGSEFNASGSNINDVGFGFTSPLASKTSFTFDITTSKATAMSLSQSFSNPADNAGAGSFPMAYYNFDTKEWEKVGTGISFSDSVAGTANLDSQMLGFSPSASGRGNAIINPSQSAVCFDNFGFPSHPKFHATSSQLLQLTSSITKPFVLEKIIYEFTGSFSGSAVFFDTEGMFNTFFLLNQRNPYEAQVIIGDNVLGNVAQNTINIPDDLQISQNGPIEHVDTFRDVVTYAQVSSFAEQINSSSSEFDEFARRELVIKGPLSDPGWTGRYTLSGTVKAPAKFEYASEFFDALYGETSIRYAGGRGGFGRPCGRDLVSGFISNSNNIEKLSAGSAGIKVSKPTNINAKSPYILLPSDKIILGWQTAWLGNMETSPYEYAPSLTIAPGKAHITFIGSLLTDGHEFHETLNQPLTSNAIHETIGSVSVTDQFDVEPAQLYKGTSLGEYVTGAIGFKTSGSLIHTIPGNYPIAAADPAKDRYPSSSFYLNRGVVAKKTVKNASLVDYSPASGGTSSEPAWVANSRIPRFIRGRKSTTIGERFFDTFLPKIENIIKVDGGDVAAGSLRATISIGDSTSLPTTAAKNWVRSFPFEPRFSHLQRVKTQSNRMIASSSAQGVGPQPVRLTIYSSDTQNYTFQQDIEDPALGGLNPTSKEDLLNGFFCSGDGDNNVVEPIVNNVLSAGGANVQLTRHRAFKYGIKSTVPQYTYAVWRTDRFGQLRDMLEQRQDGKFFNEIANNEDGLTSPAGLSASPIQVKFVEPRTNIITNPNRTFASNLSIEATSSLPYFDGHIKNREDPLDLQNINTSIVIV